MPHPDPAAPEPDALLAERVALLCLCASRARRVAADAEAAGRKERRRAAERLSRVFWARAQAAAGTRQR